MDSPPLPISVTVTGCGAARRDAPHLVPEAVTRRGLLGAQCTRPSLMGNPWGFFTFGVELRPSPMTVECHGPSVYAGNRHAARRSSPTMTGRHRGEVLNEKSPHYAPKTVTARNAATCANTLFPRVLTGESRNIVTFDSAYRLLCAPADGRVAALDPALHRGGKTVMGRLRRGVLTLSLCRQNRYTPSLIGERCYSLYSLTCANVARSPVVHLAHTTSLQLTASIGCKLHPRMGVSNVPRSRLPVDLHVLGLEPLPRPGRQHRHLAQRPDD